MVRNCGIPFSAGQINRGRIGKGQPLYRSRPPHQTVSRIFGTILTGTACRTPPSTGERAFPRLETEIGDPTAQSTYRSADKPSTLLDPLATRLLGLGRLWPLATPYYTPSSA